MSNAKMAAMKALAWVALGCLVGVAHAAPAQPRARPKPAENALPEITANDNRAPAGQLRGGVLTIELEARTGRWYPEEKDGPGIAMQAFAEPGKPLEIPGPLIRVPEGAVVRATVHNAIPGATLVMHALHTRPGDSNDTFEVAPGATREVRFKAGAAGTYFYWATTTGAPFLERRDVDSQLSGAFIVDPPGDKLADDRVFVIGLWAVRDLKAKPPKLLHAALVINGRSWPHTERLTYTAGETVHWRWINTSLANHPMHMHGHFYRVDSTGNAERDTIYPEQERRLVVTELMPPGRTMSLTWFPNRAGNWLFHCHVIPHISPELRMGPKPAANESSAHGESQHALESMAGLVLGLRVLPARGAPQPARSKQPPRKLRLSVQLLPGRYGKDAGYGFVLEEGRHKTPSSEAGIPGPPIVLTRGQPVRITVINRLPEPTAIHWHGIELPSYYDGVPGMSGDPGHIAPPIPPGGSFVAAFTPPRAGTFIYHSHMDDQRQLSSGLYGPIIVLEPGQAFDPETDRILIFGVGGPADDALILLNGRVPGKPIELRAGVKCRFRFINIAPDDPRLTISLLGSAQPVNWRAVGKDGAALPASQATLRPASQVISVGETYDFEFAPPAPGELRLEILRPRVVFRPEAHYTVPVHVR